MWGTYLRARIRWSYGHVDACPTNSRHRSPREPPNMDFHLPELGEGVYEAELVEWRVQPGDTVKRGQELAEVVTDKASMPLPAPFFGRVSELRAEPGDMLKIGEVILTFEPTARGGETKEAEPKETDGESRAHREEQK